MRLMVATMILSGYMLMSTIVFDLVYGNFAHNSDNIHMLLFTYGFMVISSIVLASATLKLWIICCYEPKKDPTSGPKSNYGSSEYKKRYTTLI